jgi:hypothetical protein
LSHAAADANASLLAADAARISGFSSPRFRFRISRILQTTGEDAPLIRGCVRSSPRGQTIAAQVKRLRAAGANKIYRETASGAGSRVKLLHMLDDLDTGDVVMVTRLDRLALAKDDLTNILAAIAEKGAGFHSLRWAERHRGD